MRYFVINEKSFRIKSWRIWIISWNVLIKFLDILFGRIEIWGFLKFSGSKIWIDLDIFWAPDGLPDQNDQNLRMTEVGCERKCLRKCRCLQSFCIIWHCSLIWAWGNDINFLLLSSNIQFIFSEILKWWIYWIRFWTLDLYLKHGLNIQLVWKWGLVVDN